VIRRAIVLAAIVVALFDSGLARADAYDAALSRAVAAKERALEVNDPPHWEEALRLFSEADAIRSTKESKFEVGFAAAKMQQHDVAVEAYQASLDLGLVGPARSTAEGFLAQHAGAMARVEIVAPAGAAVFVAERFRGRTPLARPVVVFGGQVRVRLALPNGENRIEDMSVPPGTLRVLRVGPPAAPPANAAPPPPVAPSNVAPPISPVAPTQAPTVAPESGGRAAGFILVGTGAAIAVAGAVLVPVAASKIDGYRGDLAASCDIRGDDTCVNAKSGQQQQAQDAVDGIATWKTVRTGAWIGVGAGAAAALVGVIALASGHGTPPHASAEVVPMYGGAMVVYGGHF
jgi:hypothetical protein